MIHAIVFGMQTLETSGLLVGEEGVLPGEPTGDSLAYGGCAARARGVGPRTARSRRAQIYPFLRFNAALATLTAPAPLLGKTGTVTIVTVTT